MQLNLFNQNMNHLNMNLLYPVGIPVPRDTNIHVAQVLHLSPVFSRQTDHHHTPLVRGIHGIHHVGGITGRADSQQNIPGFPVCLHVTGEHVIETEIIRHTSQMGWGRK